MIVVIIFCWRELSVWFLAVKAHGPYPWHDSALMSPLCVGVGHGNGSRLIMIIAGQSSMMMTDFLDTPGILVVSCVSKPLLQHVDDIILDAVDQMLHSLWLWWKNWVRTAETDANTPPIPSHPYPPSSPASCPWCRPAAAGDTENDKRMATSWSFVGRSKFWHAADSMTDGPIVA